MNYVVLMHLTLKAVTVASKIERIINEFNKQPKK